MKQSKKASKPNRVASARTVITPDGELHLDQVGARASIHFAKHEGGWIAEFRVIRLAGLNRACTMPLTTQSMRLRTKSEAVAVAAERMLAANEAATVGISLNAAQRKALSALEVWAKSLAMATRTPPIASPTGPLAGKRFLDCFAGIGGFHVAMTSQGAVCSGAIELDAEARATYRANHPGIYPLHDDIRSATAKMFGGVDIVCGGFPCQSFSQAGEGKGFADAEKGALFFEVARLIGALSPSMALLENVAGLCSHDDGRTFEVILDRLTTLGYAVATATLNASDFGLAQMRERLFLVCIHDRALGNRVDPFRFPKGADASVVIEDILESVPAVASCYRNMVRSKSDPVVRTEQIQVVGLIDGKPHQGYRVASPIGKGFTLCANSGGAGRKTGLYLVKGKPRTLSPREAARMQGFPESFTPHVNPNTALRQFGNAVAVPVISAIAEQLGSSVFI
jgi:DNA (cytosine-5)-methyltransferase 1